MNVLRRHFEVVEHTARFIELNEDDNAASEIMTGGNLTKILDLLPLCLRQDDDSLETAETNASKRTVFELSAQVCWVLFRFDIIHLIWFKKFADALDGWVRSYLFLNHSSGTFASVIKIFFFT